MQLPIRSPSANAMVAVREHSESKVPHPGLCKHIKQVSRICEMHIVVAAAMGKEEIRVIETRYVSYRRVDISIRICLRRRHVPFGVD